MNPALAALVVHDLKNELGALEAALERSTHAPSAKAARQNHLQCMALREHFVQFLTLYGQPGGLRILASDESPAAMLEATAAHAAQAHPELRIQVDVDEQAPPCWYFDPRLVRMALDAALHNAGRFARSSIRLQALAVDKHLVFRIDDDGPGPDPSARDPGAAHATGLGGTLCQAVAEAHTCGQRKGHSSLGPGPGGGARFELWLA
jgi:signal transduction histidine kinase